MKPNLSHRYFYFTLSIFFVIAQCQTPESEDKNSFKTKSGYIVDVISRTTNNPARAFAYVKYTSDIMIGDTVVNSSRLGAPYLFYQTDSDISNMSVSPVAEALHLMNDQDSVILWYPLEDEKQKPEWFGDAEYLEYRIKIHEVMDEQAYALAFQDAKNEIQEQALLLQSLEPDAAEFSTGIYQRYRDEGTTGWTDLGQGVMALIHDQGTGPKPRQGRYVSVAYYGRSASTGTSFSNSFKDGRAFSFKVGLREAIDGWDIAIRHLPEGSRVSLFVPSSLAYGERGFPPEIGPNEDLLFYMEVLRVI